jgi:hypothetical protein
MRGKSKERNPRCNEQRHIQKVPKFIAGGTGKLACTDGSENLEKQTEQ